MSDAEEIPSAKEMELPILEFLKNGEKTLTKEINNHVADVLEVTDEQRKIPQANGNAFLFANRVGWSLTELKRKGEITKPGYGVWEITQKGMDRLKGTGASQQAPPQNDNEEEYPIDLIEQVYTAHRTKIKEQLLDKILENEPRWFENLVKELLLKMGYGEVGMLTKKTGDEGIDVIIMEDPLGLGKIWAQVKRYAKDAVISNSMINEFCGSIGKVDDRGRGVFVTTGRFSKPAEDAIGHRPIVFIDGNKLTDLMIKYRMGVKEENNYSVYSIDERFFIDET